MLLCGGKEEAHSTARRCRTHLHRDELVVLVAAAVRAIAVQLAHKRQALQPLQRLRAPQARPSSCNTGESSLCLARTFSSVAITTRSPWFFSILTATWRAAARDGPAQHAAVHPDCCERVSRRACCFVSASSAGYTCTAAAPRVSPRRRSSRPRRRGARLREGALAEQRTRDTVAPANHLVLLHKPPHERGSRSLRLRRAVHRARRVAGSRALPARRHALDRRPKCAGSTAQRSG